MLLSNVFRLCSQCKELLELLVDEWIIVICHVLQLLDLVVNLVLLLLVVGNFTGVHIDHGFYCSQVFLVKVLHVCNILAVNLGIFCFFLSVDILVLIVLALVNCPLDGAWSISCSLDGVAEEANKARGRLCYESDQSLAHALCQSLCSILLRPLVWLRDHS